MLVRFNKVSGHRQSLVLNVAPAKVSHGLTLPRVCRAQRYIVSAGATTTVGYRSMVESFKAARLRRPAPRSASRRAHLRQTILAASEVPSISAPACPHLVFRQRTSDLRAAANSPTPTQPATGAGFRADNVGMTSVGTSLRDPGRCNRGITACGHSHLTPSRVRNATVASMRRQPV